MKKIKEEGIKKIMESEENATSMREFIEPAGQFLFVQGVSSDMISISSAVPAP